MGAEDAYRASRTAKVSPVSHLATRNRRRAINSKKRERQRAKVAGQPR
jgi:hypothetical protein